MLGTPRRRHRRALIALAMATVATCASLPASANAAIDHLAGCDTTALPRNDDGSSSLVTIPFTVDFFGNQHNSLYVNNNGNVTFGTPLSTFTPFDLSQTDKEIIAPFFADVDTRNAASDVVTYGNTTYAGRQAFCAMWDGVNGVGYYSSGADKLNKFQLLIVDRSDTGAGNFDFIFNYDQVQWETGSASGGSGGLGGSSARAGYSNGDPQNSLELTGSAVNGGFLDTNQSTGLIRNSRGSTTLGRYVFEVRNGAPPVGGRVFGQVTASGQPEPSSLVEVCDTFAAPRCVTTRTNSSGNYQVQGLDDGMYRVKASPNSSDNNHSPVTVGPVQVHVGQSTQRDVVLSTLDPPPSSSGVTQRGTTTNGAPVIYWHDNLVLSTHACPEAFVTYAVTQGATTLRSGSFTPDPSVPDRFTANIAQFAPTLGWVIFNIHVTGCTDPSHNRDEAWSAYIDPSGFVKNTVGTAVAGATVTLLHSDSSAGPFDTVPNGSDIMSPANRTNPDTTDSAGHFGWDVVAGYYQVRAQKAGCTAVGGDPFTSTAVLTIPPPVTDLELTLDCGDTPPPTDVCDTAGAFLGTTGNDSLQGTPGDDILCGRGGKDIIYGNGGNDTIIGGTGVDHLYGGTGADSIDGRGGNDTMNGDGGDDSILGGEGNDVLFGGGSGNDSLKGEGGNDRLEGRTGNDAIVGGTGVDKMLAGTGNDSVTADDGNAEIVKCEAGNDTATADGSDTVTGCEHLNEPPII
jgi:hypothetical protein